MSFIASYAFSSPIPHPAMFNNPKTIVNRRAIHVKVGLDIAEHGADFVFCANICCKLQALHRNAQWSSWNDEKKECEEKIIRELEVKRDERK